VIFCSDNGGLAEIGNNGELRGNKGALWEGGHRVPAIAHWPRYIKAGSVSNETILIMDFFPTFVNLSKSDTKHDFNFDGVDITRHLIEEKELPDRTVFWKYRNQKVARYENWKLIMENDTLQLYDLKTDLQEQIDLIDTEESIVSQLKIELDKWEKNVTKGVNMKTE
jgi:arylsulfatase A-like enzyme